MKTQLSGLVKQVQQMQEKVKQVQTDLEKIEVIGDAGGGLCRITMTCRNQVRRVSIENSLLVDDKEMLEDLIAAALNDALHKVEKIKQEKMDGMTNSLPMPLDFSKMIF